MTHTSKVTIYNLRDFERTFPNCDAMEIIATRSNGISIALLIKF